MEGVVDEFDVYLVSNGSMNIYPDNKLSSFTNLLSQPMYLEGNWSVALAEITFPTLSSNVPETTVWKIKGVNWEEIVPNTNNMVQRTMHTLEAGFYSSIDEIINSIRGVTNSFGEDIKYDVNQQRKVWIEVPENVAFTFHPPDVLHMCGFETNQLGSITLLPISTYVFPSGDEEETEELKHLARIVKKHGKDVATFPFDLSGGSNLMFVYTNIIEYQPVGDTRAPVLRLIPLQHSLVNNRMVEDESIHHKSFTNMQFKKLLTNTVAAIQIELRNENGHLMPFLSRGRTAITLRFKKIHSNANA